MSAETLQYLNTHTLTGFTLEKGKAWHHDGDSDNQFDYAVPWHRVEELITSINVHLTIPQVEIGGCMVEAEGFQAVVDEASGQVFHIAGSRYEIHQHSEWLLDELSQLLDTSQGELMVGSAGLLRGGALAWVQVRPAETVNVGGDEMLPWILATTAHDGSSRTRYRGQRQRVVCDNTLRVALGEQVAEYAVSHTKRSSMRVTEAREALEIIFTAQGEFDREIEKLMNTPFGDHEFSQLSDALHPIPDSKIEDGKVKNQRARDNAGKIHSDLVELWASDIRVGEYHGTAWGALQAHNTWFHWGRTRGTGGDEELLKARQLNNAITGETDVYDRKVYDAMTRVLEEV